MRSMSSLDWWKGTGLRAEMRMDLKKEPLYLKIYNDLLLDIKEGIYPAGSRLPSEKELSEQYQVSRITSKKALEMLAEGNMITRMPGKGSYVLGTGEDAREDKEAEAAGYGRRLLGVVLDSFGTAFGGNLLAGIERECRRAGFYPVLRCTYGSMEEESRAIRELITLGVSGLLLMCAQGEVYNETVLRLFVEKFPIVLVDRELKGLPIPFVGTDNYRAAKELTEILLSRGHTRNCFLSHPVMRTSSVKARFNGFRDCHLEHSLLTNESLWITDIGSMLPTPDENEVAEYEDVKKIENFVKDHPEVTGFFAVDHTIGVMVYKILKRLGLEREKEIVFFDGLDEANDSNPVFTHVMQGEFLMGVRAVKCLRDWIEGKEVAETTYIPYRIVQGNREQQK